MPSPSSQDDDGVLASCPDPSRFPRLEQLVQRARDAHATPPRHYHAWSHVVALCRAFVDVKAHVEAPCELWSALLFHDAIYVAGRTDNEVESARLASSVLREHGAQVDVPRVEELVRLTARHGNTLRLKGDDAWMMDLDTGVLGAEDAAYDRYAAGVRAEYLPVVHERAYDLGRARFLARMLKQPRIFHGDAMEARLGARARANLARERAALPWWARWMSR